MPNYNHGHFIDDALGAIAAQSILPDEVIVVDDDSTDDSVARLEALAASMPWLRIIKQSENRGVNAACNTGLKAVGGDFVLFSAMDDRMHGQAVARVSSAIAEFPRSGIIFSDQAVMNADGSEMRILPLDLPAAPRHFSSHEFVRLLQRQFFFFSVANVWFDVNQLRELGGFPPELRWHGDLFAAYAIAFSAGAIYVPEAVSYFRMLEQSYSAAGRRSGMQEGVLRAWHAKTKQIGRPQIRTAFVEAAVLPEFTLRSALILLKVDPGYLTLRLVLRLARLIVWTAIAPYVRPSWRDGLRNVRRRLRLSR